MKQIRQIDHILSKAEAWAIILLLSVMVILSGGQVILRNFFNQGILWADILLRQIVLWVALIGASLAVRERKHISIDVLPRMLPKSLGKPIRIFTDFSAGIISAFLTYAAWNFLQFEKGAETVLFNNIPVWIFQIILPLSFGLISIRFILAALDGLLSYWDSNK